MMSNRDLYLLVTGFGEKFGNNLSLEEYLRALWQIVSQAKPVFPSLVQVSKWLEAAFRADVPPFDLAWLERTIEDPYVFTTREDWENLILFQIADLHRMANAGQLENEWRFYGIDSPSGHRWYNFDPLTYLECGVRGAVGGYQEEEVIVLSSLPDGESADSPIFEIDELGWDGFAAILECGRVYE